MLEKKLNQLTPLTKQYFEIQLKYPDAIVCLEMGKFYEIMEIEGIGGHAKKASQLLNLVLTQKNKKKINAKLEKGEFISEKEHLNNYFMAGVPNHVGEKYFQQLVDNNQTVVVVSQVKRGTSKNTIKKVERYIEKILSPGINISDQLAEEKPNYFCGIYSNDDLIYGVSLIDVSTGEVLLTEIAKDDLDDFINKHDPTEILYISKKNILKFSSEKIVHWYPIKKGISTLAQCGKILERMYDLKNPTNNPLYNLENLNLNFWSNGALSLANVINYLSISEHNKILLKKMSAPTTLGLEDFLILPKNSLLSLEIFQLQNGNEGEGTLYHCLDRCKTAMGRRKLKQWLMNPLVNLEIIEERQSKVKKFFELEDYLENLSKVYDVARLARKMNIENLMPHEIGYMFESLTIFKEILLKRSFLSNDKTIKLISSIVDKIEDNIIVDKAKMAGFNIATKDQYMKGKYFKNLEKHYNNALKAESSLKEMISLLESILFKKGQKIKLETKSSQHKLIITKGMAENISEEIKTLEIENECLKIYELLPERFHNPEVKNIKINFKKYESKVEIIADPIQKVLEYAFNERAIFLRHLKVEWKKFQRDFVDEFGSEIFPLSELIGEIDVLSNFAKLSKERKYSPVKITNTNNTKLKLTNLRHPVVENSKKLAEGFVSNTVSMDKDNRIKVLYGANSSGKSTLLKSIAHAILMAQMGCFIAADEGSEFNIFEALLTRMSTFDLISEGKSTFVMEMSELKQALDFKEKRSLFLFDEIGRGTSVEDGEKIAFGVLNYLAAQAKETITLFATHYHNLFDKIKEHKSINIYHLACYTNENGILVFERKLIKGPGTGSYGLEVAASCGIPEEIIRLAKNYDKSIFKMKKSNYNRALQDHTCEFCKVNPVQETHHIVEQKQGKVKEFIDENGETKSINHKTNLVLLCSTCHRKVTNKEIEIIKKLFNVNGEVELKFKKLD